MNIISPYGGRFKKTWEIRVSPFFVQIGYNISKIKIKNWELKNAH